MTAELHQAFMILLERRRYTREFSPEPLPDHLLEWLRESTRPTPGAGGDPGLRCVFMTRKEDIVALTVRAEDAFSRFLNKVESRFAREEVEKYAGSFSWLAKAPALAFFTVRRVPTFLEDCLGDIANTFFGADAAAAMAVQNLLLAAESLGLGACPVTGPLACGAALEDFLHIDRQNHKLVCLVALGRKKQEDW